MTKNSAIQLANYIIKYHYKKAKKLLKKADFNHDVFDVFEFKHLKLHKILYFLYGLYYSETKTELFTDDFVAYRHGPVVVEIYKTIKQKYPNKPYANLNEDLFGDAAALNLSAENTKTVNGILDKLYQFSAWRLVELSHMPGSPWQATEQSKVIDKAAIHEYFSTKILV